MLDLWTPPGSTYNATSALGLIGGTGERAHGHKFTFTYRGRSREVYIVDDGSLSEAHIEDMAAQAAETWQREVDEDIQRRQGTHKPSAHERREVGAVLREIRARARKRRESSAGKLYFPGVH